MQRYALIIWATIRNRGDAYISKYKSRKAHSLLRKRIKPLALAIASKTAKPLMQQNPDHWIFSVKPW